MENIKLVIELILVVQFISAVAIVFLFQRLKFFLDHYNTNMKNRIISGIPLKFSVSIISTSFIVNTVPIFVFLNNAINSAAKKNNTSILPILFNELYR